MTQFFDKQYQRTNFVHGVTLGDGQGRVTVASGDASAVVSTSFATSTSNIVVSNLTAGNSSNLVQVHANSLANGSFVAGFAEATVETGVIGWTIIG